MKFSKLAVCLLVILISAKADADQALPLGRWIKDAENILRGQTSAAVLSMRIKKETYQRDYDLMVLTDDRSASSKVMIKMLGPALWRGNVTLKVDDKITFYDPRSNRVTVMGSSMLGDNWMGSHFTNDDLMRETDLSKHYTNELVEQGPGQDEVGASVTRYRIRLAPKPIAPVAWGKVIYRLYLDQNRRVFPEQLDYYA
ncbi:MAG: outer membrane lipoprotein-sorting protein, partial [Gammaproteobacteria bacterium]